MLRIMNKGVFITGTDTGVGKTFVAAGLIKALIKRGISVCPMKPVESGCKMRKGSLVPADASALVRASCIKESIDLINPYRLRLPLAPSVAAEIEGKAINRKKIISSYAQLSRRYEMIIVEGAGGIMVPVYKRYLFLDLACDLGLPVLIVARPGLGTINHTLLSIEAIRNRGLKVLGVIINNAAKSATGMSEKSNPDIIKKLGKVSVPGIIPFFGGPRNVKMRKIFDIIAGKIW